MKRISTLLPLFLLSLFVGCGQKREVFKAPTTQSEAGIIATCTTRQQAESISQKYKANYRVLNEKKKLIEIIGLDQKTLSKELPKAKLISNLVEYQLLPNDFASPPSQPKPDLPFEAFFTQQEGPRNILSNFEHLFQIQAHQLTSNQDGSGVIIAILDTGVDYQHPHLAPNILTELGTMVGKDFVNSDDLPMDDNGHGTHVAGLAAGTLSGVAPKAKIMPIKVLNHRGTSDLGTIAAGVLYAINNGADILNMSFGGEADLFNQDLQRLFRYLDIAKQKGILMVAASGNGGADYVGDCNDERPIYPANTQNNHVISVASVDENNNLSVFSNYGASVHIAAPGSSSSYGGLLSTKIYQCQRNCQLLSGYARKQGTSMSTPLVAGLAAVLKSQWPSRSFAQIRQIIFNSGTYHPQLENKLQFPRVINAYQAVSL